ncbi:MAG: peptide chain release factor N(5)-glutamine methyltransferase, partial [Oscillospiraceae bacterium]|nr:peptide chain release factor N(5)-glutamine methyltransferase [Oscillospiraceae bacterium]
RIDVMHETADEQTEQKLMEYAQKRKDGYPLQYIIGIWQFFDLDLYVGEGVLVPRQDTETVCEAAFEVINTIDTPTVSDLCSGSGCIALATKRFCPNANVTAVEKSDEAFRYLQKNIAHTQLDITAVKADIVYYADTVADETVDVIISNPPYIDPAVKLQMQKEVTFEPEMALFAEDKGLWFYSFIAKSYYSKLKKGGYLVFEYGFDQKQAVRDILLNNGYTVVKEITDMGTNPRGVVAKK